MSVGELVDSGGGLNRIASISVAHQAAPGCTGTLPKVDALLVARLYLPTATVKTVRDTSADCENV